MITVGQFHIVCNGIIRGSPEKEWWTCRLRMHKIKMNRKNGKIVFKRIASSLIHPAVFVKSREGDFMNCLHLPSINEIDEMAGGCYTQTWSKACLFRHVLGWKFFGNFR
uniref:hypothetical protein n=1 Tax=Enterocloster aldenensis TaxID=358742 RepID=UPI0014091305